MKNIPIRKIKVAQNEPALSQHFSIRKVEEVLDGKKIVQELHRHDYYYILAIKKGTGVHEIDFSSYVVSDNTVFFIRPGHVHKLTLNKDCKGYLIQFKNDFFYPGDLSSRRLLWKAGNKNFCRTTPILYQKIDAILRNIYREFTDKQEGYEQVVKAGIGIFFIELVRNRKNLKKPESAVNAYAEERLDEFLELLEAHIANHFSVLQYAEMLHLSSFQLNAITKLTLGKTCSEVINEYIILEAKRYLLATTEQVSRIAYHLGYEDASYFIRFFKKHTGLSPEAFRKNFK